MTGIHDSMCNITDSSCSIDILYSGSVAVIHVVLIAYIISCTHMIYSGVKVVVLTTYTWQWQYRYHIQRFLCVRCSLKSCNKFQNKPERIVCPFTLRVYSVWNSPFSPLKKNYYCVQSERDRQLAHMKEQLSRARLERTMTQKGSSPVLGKSFLDMAQLEGDEKMMEKAHQLQYKFTLQTLVGFIVASHPPSTSGPPFSFLFHFHE